MSQTSFTPGHVQSDDSRPHQSLLDEIQRLKGALGRAQREIAMFKEDWEKERAEKHTLRIDLEELRSSSHGTSSDQISVQYWQFRAEEAENRAEEAQRRAGEAQRRAGEAQRRAEEAQRRAEEAQHRAEEAQCRDEQAERENLKRRNGNLQPLRPKERPVLIPKERPVLIPKARPRLIPKERPVLIPKERPRLIPKERPVLIPKERPRLIPKVHRGFAEDSSLRASAEGPASRTLEHPSSQQQSSSRQGGPLNRSNADYHSRFPQETTGAVKAPVLKLDEPSNLREDAIPRGGPKHPPRPNISLQGVPTYLPPIPVLTLSARSSRLPDIPTAPTTSAVPEPPQTETESLGVHQPGAEPAGAQPTDRNCEVNSPSPRTTGDSDQDEEQTPDMFCTSVAARKTSKGIPVATSQIRGKYWPRGRI